MIDVLEHIREPLLALKELKESHYIFKVPLEKLLTPPNIRLLEKGKFDNNLWRNYTLMLIFLEV